MPRAQKGVCSQSVLVAPTLPFSPTRSNGEGVGFSSRGALVHRFGSALSSHLPTPFRTSCMHVAQRVAWGEVGIYILLSYETGPANPPDLSFSSLLGGTHIYLTYGWGYITKVRAGARSLARGLVGWGLCVCLCRFVR